MKLDAAKFEMLMYGKFAKGEILAAHVDKDFMVLQNSMHVQRLDNSLKRDWMHTFDHHVAVFFLSNLHYVELDGSVSRLSYAGEFIERLKVDTDASFGPEYQRLDEIG